MPLKYVATNWVCFSCQLKHTQFVATYLSGIDSRSWIWKLDHRSL